MDRSNLFFAKVIDNNDPDQDGRIKVFAEDVMYGWEQDHYPWARSASSKSGTSNLYGDSYIPEVNSFVLVFTEKPHSLKNWYYISGMDLKNVNPHSLFTDNVKSKIGSDGSYPNVKFNYYQNGVCIAVDSSISNPEIMLYHPKDSYFFIDSSGKIIIKGDVSIKGNLDVDKEIIWNKETVPTHASTHNHVSGIPGNPTGPPPAGS